MKRLLYILLISLTSLSLSAQNYTHSVGTVVGSMFGFSYKGFSLGVDGLGVQLDLKAHVAATQGSMYLLVDGKRVSDPSLSGGFDYWTFEANPQILYQKYVHQFNEGNLSMYGGGGISLGMMQSNRTVYSTPYVGTITRTDIMGKFGINAIVGVELEFDEAPVAISFDFRPGYGLGFDGDSYYGETNSAQTLNFFDWALAFGIRYCM